MCDGRSMPLPHDIVWRLNSSKQYRVTSTSLVSGGTSHSSGSSEVSPAGGSAGTALPATMSSLLRTRTTLPPVSYPKVCVVTALMPASDSFVVWSLLRRSP
jgi:hypothetical protein